MRALTWRGETKMGEDYEIEEIPADMADRVEEYRTALIEAVAETDDDLMEAYLGGEELTVDQLKHGIRKIVKDRIAYPVLCGSAFKNKGVQAMLDAVIQLLPSPVDRPAVQGVDEDEKEDTRPADDKAPFSALAFKIMTDPFVGQLTFFRVYSGTLTSGSSVINSTKGKTERIGRLLKMHANKR